VREGEPSPTAQRVAAYRLSYERLAAPFGDPKADERLARDVAGSVRFEQYEAMGRYLRFRTTFFDRVVVNALARNVAQVATIGAGYDGRALRYAKPGVRWFEVDHPATQRDKRLRLERLSIDASEVTFVGTDLADGALSSALIGAGWEPDAPSAMLCEGVVVYLEANVLEALLNDLRAVATVGTRLAVSLSVQASGPEELARRRRFEETVAALGEPARNWLDHDSATVILDRTRWHPVDVSEHSRRAGFVVAAPVWNAAADGAPPTVGRIGRFMERMYGRRGLGGLDRHLSASYGISVTDLRQLDVGVFRVKRDDGRDWVARVFAPERPSETTEGDAEILRLLERVGFPAERCAAAEPVTSYEGQAVLVTEHVAGKKPSVTQRSFALLGDLLGRLHTLPPGTGAAERPGGAWHHWVFQGDPNAEKTAAVGLLDAAEARVEDSERSLYVKLRSELAQAETRDGLPHALIHPDFVPANAITSREHRTVVVDWTGAGRGPRLWSLAFLLWATGFERLRSVDSVVAAYRRHVELTSAELERLAPAIAARPVIFASWAFCTGRKSLPEVVESLSANRARAEGIAGRVERITGH
jgi:methyltransferase (TIGR00027 family)